jgi:hypothetical protein
MLILVILVLTLVAAVDLVVGTCSIKPEYHACF